MAFLPKILLVATSSQSLAILIHKAYNICGVSFTPQLPEKNYLTFVE